VIGLITGVLRRLRANSPCAERSLANHPGKAVALEEIEGTMTETLETNTASIATALLLSEDGPTVALVTQCLEELAISTDVCAGNADFYRLLNRKKVEAIIIDSPLNRASVRFLDIVRSSPSNRSAITFVVSDGRKQNLACGEGPNFFIESPLSKEALHKMLKVSFGLIVRERRRYFRCPISIPATLRSDEFGNVSCRVTNISEGGMALNSHAKLCLKLRADVGFEIPNQLSRQVVKSEIVWCDSGRAGIRFLSQTAQQRVELQGWLARQLESSFPDRVLKTFQALTGSRPDDEVHASTV